MKITMPSEKFQKRTLSDWSIEWWQWITSIPELHNPAIDETGENCCQHQSGPVWKLAGTTKGHAERRCNIPHGSAILIPVITTQCSFVKYEQAHSIEDLQSIAESKIDRVSDMHFTIDNTHIPNLWDYRAQFSLFTIHLQSENFLGLAPGTLEVVSDGIWILISDVGNGVHKIAADARESDLDFETSVSYDLT
jgi:hypothetical protein